MDSEITRTRAIPGNFYVGVTAPAAPTAEFIGAPTSGSSPLAVTFTNQSTGSITSYLWDFGDGQTSTTANPSHVYSVNGTYTVSLTVTGPGGSDVRTRSAYITTSTFEPAAGPAWLTEAAGQWGTIPSTGSTYAIRDYSGVAFVDTGASLKMIAGLGGGHAGNVTDNSIHALTLSDDTPSWSQLHASGSPVGYDSATMNYFPADGTPGPRHLYSGVISWPERNVILFSGSFWGLGGNDFSDPREVDGFRLDNNTFEAEGTYPLRDNQETHHWTVRDPATGIVYAVRQDGSNPRPGRKMTPGLVVSDWHPASGGDVTTGPTAFDTRRSAVLSFGPSDHKYWSNILRSTLFDASSGAKTAVSIDTGSAAYADFAADLAASLPVNPSVFGRYLSAAMVYDEQADCYYWYNGDDGYVSGRTQRVYQLFPEQSGSWFMAAIDGGGATVPANGGGATRIGTHTMHFVDRWRTLLLPRDKSNNVHYLRVPFSTLLDVRSGSVTGAVPYTATLIPLQGEVPAGTTVASPDDTSMRATIISTHSDGSAAVIVVAGSTIVTANSNKKLHVRTATAIVDTPLTAARIDALVSSVAVNFAGSYGNATITDFTSPSHVWWANSKVICARYVLAAPTPGATALEAVIDITAFADSDRALVEVVVENGKIDALSSTGASKPADATYTGATVSVNGAIVATVDSSAAPTGVHQAFRSWYAKGWVGGDPQTRATQRTIDIQRHPLFWRCDRNSTFDFSTYATDSYTPWSTGRHRGANMGGGGDHDSIGPLPKWEALTLQSGDYRGWNATEASSLAILSFNVNYRDTTGFVPSSARMSTKFTKDPEGDGTWPYTSDGSSQRGIWEQAHQPASGLMAFLGRPSPVFIEVAQKIAVTTGTINNDPARIALSNLTATVGITDLTGVTHFGQVRAFAWGTRNTTHATFLSPDASAWRTGGKVWLGRSARMIRSFILDGYQESLRLLWQSGPGTKTGDGADTYSDGSTPWPGRQEAIWPTHFCIGELHRLAESGLITDTTEAGYIQAAADWISEQPVRWVNDQSNGAWRYIRDRITLMRADTSVPANYADAMAHDVYIGAGPTSVVGGWGSLGSVNKQSWALTEAGGVETTAQASYPAQFWHALIIAVERGVPGATQAWETVQSNITGLSSWRTGFATEPRWGSWPRI